MFVDCFFFFNILVNQKRGILVKEKQTAQLGNVRESYSRQNTQIHAPKKKNFLYFNEGTIDYNQQCHPLHLGNKQYKQFPQKKKRRENEEKGGRKEKKESANGKRRRKKKEREEERLRKRGRESQKEKEKEEKEEKEKEEEKMEKAVLKVH